MKNFFRFLLLHILMMWCISTYAQTDSSASFLFNVIKAEQDPIAKESMAIKLEKKVETEPSSKGAMLANYSRMYVASAFAAVGNVTKAKEWMNKCSDSAYLENTLLAVSSDLMEAACFDAAVDLLKPYINRTSSVNNKVSDKMPGISRPDARTFSLEYGRALFKQKKYKEALSYLAPNENDTSAGAKGNGLYIRQYAEYYALAFMAIGNKTDAVVVAHKVMAMTGSNSKEFKAGLLQLYKALYGNTGQYQQEADSLYALDRKRLQEKVLAMEVNKPAPAFHLTGTNGKEVSLESLRGKTIIVDFWATWCIPCVGSFPGMQKAVNYYSNDTTVVFLFIHTSEKTATATADAQKLLDKKHYAFNLYMDLKDPLTHKNAVAEAFSIRALPTKFIIDKKGIIRFIHTGFVSEDEAVEDIRTMVELTNAK